MAPERTPFDSIEGSLEYIGLLREAIETAKKSVAQESERARQEAATRRLEALQLIAYKLDRLAWHVDGSRRLLHDLRMLKRLLLGERQLDATSKQAARNTAFVAGKRSRAEGARARSPAIAPSTPTYHRAKDRPAGGA
jgi:hypothetical protein